MEDDLNIHRQQFSKLLKLFEKDFAPLNARVLTELPPRGGWSVAQTLEHLNLSLEKVFGAFERVIARGLQRALFASGPFSHSAEGHILLRLMESAPHGLYFRSHELCCFEKNLKVDEVKERYWELHQRLFPLFESACGLRLDKLKVSCASAPLLRINLHTCFSFLAIHERKHFEQMRNTLCQISR